jgi:hypothetical protein
LFQDGTTQFLLFASPPIATIDGSASGTLNGNIDYKIWCNESAAQLNAGIRYTVWKWSRGGWASTIQTKDGGTECAGTAITIAASAPTSTTIAAGDRILVGVYLIAVGGTFAGNNSRTATFTYDGTTNADSFVNLAQTLTFAADANDRIPVAGN